MTAVRQDAWNHDEDLLLAETVLRHIREGSTQLTAFEEVGKKLSRTAAACGFRWNSLVRKKYESAIAVAKKQRKELKQKRKLSAVKRESESLTQVVSDLPKKDENQESISEAQTEVDSHSAVQSLDEVIAYLNKIKTENNNYGELEQENKELRRELTDLNDAYDKLKKTHNALQKDYSSMQEDYKAMLAIMDRARKLVTIDGPSESALHVEFAEDAVEKTNK